MIELQLLTKSWWTVGIIVFRLFLLRTWAGSCVITRQNNLSTGTWKNPIQDPVSPRNILQGVGVGRFWREFRSASPIPKPVLLQFSHTFALALTLIAAFNVPLSVKDDLMTVPITNIYSFILYFSFLLLTYRCIRSVSFLVSKIGKTTLVIRGFYCSLNYHKIVIHLVHLEYWYVFL